MFVLIFKAESGYGSENSLKRHGSTVSLISNTQSTTSGGSFSKRGTRNLKEKIAELETFKDILSQQIDTLQKYFDNCADIAKQTSLINDNLINDASLKSIDFKGEAITFKATSDGVLATLCHCVELMNQREDAWRRRWDKENEKKRKMLEHYKLLKDQVNMNRGDANNIPRVLGGPDYEVFIRNFLN